ncbi:MAG: carbohydrate ABC transporter permease [Candidatus Merdivicinus sp.]
MIISRPRKVFLFFNAIFLIILAAIMLYPFLYVAASSFSNETFIAQGKVGIIPQGFNLEAYKKVMKYPLIGRSYLNTIFYTVVGTIINIIFTICGAYPLSRKRFLGRRFFLMMITFTMLFSGGLIPSFLVVKELGMVDTVWAMLIPSAINTWNMLIMRNFFAQIPKELEEAAIIDGSNDYQTLTMIILPLSTAAIATIMLFYAVGHWNEFFDALIYLRSSKLYPLQILLRNVVIQNQTADMLRDVGNDDNRAIIAESVKHATIMVSTLPILCVYPFIQKYFVTGVMVGSIKG